MIPRNHFNEGCRRGGIAIGAACAIAVAVILWILDRPIFADGAWFTYQPWDRLFKILAYSLFAYWLGNVLMSGVSWIAEGFMYGPPSIQERKRQRRELRNVLLGIPAIGMVCVGGIAAYESVEFLAGLGDGWVASALGYIVGNEFRPFASFGWFAQTVLKVGAAVVGGIAGLLVGVFTVGRWTRDELDDFLNPPP